LGTSNGGCIWVCARYVGVNANKIM